MITMLVAAGLPEGEFQADWYFSVIVAALVAVSVPAAVYAFIGVRRLWRGGEKGPAAVIGAATALAVCFFLGLLLLAAIGLLRRSVVT